ncbi:cytochrome P450 [Nonomuraea diastatica]|uniref:Cytochrome P450 n=1 Tax=Nonomuraea diastatica TaxID=1848329 RepID=A0A4R4WE14_9ACTN|nr:cytochrome P450 [Nonomuraea diastatica]TDD15487.1 cytochrome P450 [Nonomuraea diastatica]
MIGSPQAFSSFSVMLDFNPTMQQQLTNAIEMNAYMGGLVAAQRSDPGEDILGTLVRQHGDDLSDDDLIGIGNLLLIAGHETTANMLGLGTLLLLRHDPALLSEPDRFDVTRRPSAHVTFGHGIHQCLGQQLARMELRVALPALLRRFPELRLAVPYEDLRYRVLAPVNGVLSLPVTWYAMKVIIDQARCMDVGQCVMAAPEVFDQRESDGVIVLLDARAAHRPTGRTRRRAVLPGNGHSVPGPARAAARPDGT